MSESGCVLESSQVSSGHLLLRHFVGLVPFILISLAVLIPGVYDYNVIITQNLLAQSYSEITVLQWVVFFSFLAVSMIAAIWFVILAYKAFSVSCNISGAKGIMGFVAALLFSEIVAAIAIYQLSKCFF